MTVDTVDTNTDGSEMLLATSTYSGEGEETKNELRLFSEAYKSTQIDRFRRIIANTIQTIKFSEFEQNWNW